MEVAPAGDSYHTPLRRYLGEGLQSAKDQTFQGLSGTGVSEASFASVT